MLFLAYVFNDSLIEMALSLLNAYVESVYITACAAQRVD